MARSAMEAPDKAWQLGLAGNAFDLTSGNLTLLNNDDYNVAYIGIEMIHNYLIVKHNDN